MKILYLPSYFTPEIVASTYINENRNQAFADAGIEVLLYAPTPCRGISEEVRIEYSKKEHRCEKMYDGKMIVHRFLMYREGKNPILRALRYTLCWCIQLWKGLWAKDIDLIYLTSTPPIQGVLGGLLKKIKNGNI